MARRIKKTTAKRTAKTTMSPVIQAGVVFIMVAALVLVAIVGKNYL